MGTLNLLKLHEMSAGDVQIVFPAGKAVDCSGLCGFSYPTDVTVKPSDCVKDKTSDQYGGAPMPFSVLLDWKSGAFIHEGDTGSSVGCPHLAPGDAEAFFNWVVGRTKTRITVSYP